MWHRESYKYNMSTSDFSAQIAELNLQAKTLRRYVDEVVAQQATVDKKNIKKNIMITVEQMATLSQIHNDMKKFWPGIRRS